MNKYTISLLSTSLALMTLAPTMSFAREVELRRNTVIAAKLEEDLNLKEMRKGDTFFAKVTDDPDLPVGTRLKGRVIEVEREGEDRSSIDMEFFAILLPDGERIEFEGTPIPLNDKYVKRDKDGRFTVKKDKVRKDNYVIGGIVGGALLGSLLDKTFEGAFVGALAGIILAETEANKTKDPVLKRGTAIGALIERSVTLTYADSSNNGNYRDRDDYDRKAIRIEFDGHLLRFEPEEEPYYSGETLMVPLITAAEQMGMEVDVVRGDTAIYMEDKDSLVKVEQNSQEYRVNGRRKTMSKPVVLEDDVLYLPLEVLAGLKKESVYVNGTKLE